MGKETKNYHTDKPVLVHVDDEGKDCSGVTFGDTGETICPNCGSPMRVTGDQSLQEEAASSDQDRNE